MNNLDSVFSQQTESDLEFETVFDKEDSLIDLVAGFTESGDPVTGDEFATLHQTDDNATPDDLRDELQGNDTNDYKENPAGTTDYDYDDNSVKGEIGKDSDADKFYGDSENEYQTMNDSKPTKFLEGNDIDDELDDEVDIDKELDDEEDKEESSKDIDDELDDEEESLEESSKDIDDILDDSDIDAVEKDSSKSSMDLSYSTSDEDLIDMAINGKID